MLIDDLLKRMSVDWFKVESTWRQQCIVERMNLSIKCIGIFRPCMATNCSR